VVSKSCSESAVAEKRKIFTRNKTINSQRQLLHISQILIDLKKPGSGQSIMYACDACLQVFAANLRDSPTKLLGGKRRDDDLAWR
jgi:hypothetical protein